MATNVMPTGEGSKVGAHEAKHRTYDQILMELANHDMMDELEICNKYLDYTECLHANGHEELCGKFAEMAYEEYTHAKFQRMVLLDSGYSLNDESEMMFRETKKRMEMLFR